MFDAGRARRRVGGVPSSVRDVVREAFITGLAVVVPLLITGLVFVFLFNAIYPYVNAISNAVVALPVLGSLPAAANVSPQTVVELLVPVGVFAAVFVVGLLVNGFRYGERAVDYFDYAVTQIPGVGSVYESFRRMSDVMLDSDAENFQEVKLVEFPHQDAYTLGFVTTESPEVIRTSAGHPDMLTLFLPLAPNPVMGGHLVHLPEERVLDVEMTVEEGIQAIVTSGVALNENGDGGSKGLSAEALAGLAQVERADQRFAPGDALGDPRSAQARPDRVERYEAGVAPAHLDVPERVADRSRDDAERAEPPEPPAEDGRPPQEREPTESVPERRERDSDEPQSTGVSPAAAPPDRADAGGQSTEDAGEPGDDPGAVLDGEERLGGRETDRKTQDDRGPDPST